MTGPYRDEELANMLADAAEQVTASEQNLKDLVLDLIDKQVPKRFIHRHSGVARTTINRWEAEHTS